MKIFFILVQPGHFWAIVGNLIKLGIHTFFLNGKNCCRYHLTLGKQISYQIVFLTESQPDPNPPDKVKFDCNLTRPDPAQAFRLQPVQPGLVGPNHKAITQGILHLRKYKICAL